MKIAFKQIASILGVKSSIDAVVSHFAIDSRKVEKNGIFFALFGEKFDGHDFLKEVAQKGAFGAVVSKQYQGSDFGLHLLKVEDVKEALQLLAKVAFSKRKEKVIGITGSMGKTTTKEFLATLLAAKYRVAKTIGNQNTQLTIPLTLLNLEKTYDILVLEMAMTQIGHIKKLVEIAPPDMALITRIAPAGMEDFKGGLQAIAQAKAEIFSHPKTKVAIISAQASHFPEITQAYSLPKVLYGWREEFKDLSLQGYSMEEQEGGISIADSPMIPLVFQARHLKENFLGASTIARIFGISWQEIIQKAKTLCPVERRFEKIEKGGITFIQDCYNANPDSVCIALQNLPKTKGKTIGVLGSMPDLGESSTHYHKLVGSFAKNHLDLLLCIGQDAKHIAIAFAESGKPFFHFLDFDELKAYLLACCKEGDVVLIKAGNGLKLWRLLEE